MRSLRLSYLAGCLILVLATSPAQAHRMNIDARVLDEQPDRIEVHAYFDDTTDATGATVRIRDASGQEVASGKTNEKGVWLGPRPKAGKYVIRVEYVGHDRELPFDLPDDHSLVSAATQQPSVIAGIAIGAALLVGLPLGWRWRKSRSNRQSPGNTSPTSGP